MISINSIMCYHAIIILKMTEYQDNK